MYEAERALWNWQIGYRLELIHQGFTEKEALRLISVKWHNDKRSMEWGNVVPLRSTRNDA